MGTKWKVDTDGNIVMPEGYGKTYITISNPNGVLTGNLGDTAYDSIAEVTYMCISNPNGTSWKVL